MYESHKKYDIDQEMTKTKRLVRWNDTRAINQTLATQRSQEKLRQLKEEKDEDKKRVEYDMKKAQMHAQQENDQLMKKQENYR